MKTDQEQANEALEAVRQLWQRYADISPQQLEVYGKPAKRILEAIGKTQEYLAEVNRWQKRDIEKEGDIARFWFIISAEIGLVDPFLSQLCIDIAGFIANQAENKTNSTQFDDNYKAFFFLIHHAEWKGMA